MKPFAKFCTGAIQPLAILALLMIVAATPAAAQKKKKNQDDAAAAQAASNESSLARPDATVVEQTVGEFLGYWQIGDIDMLHRYFADNVAVVSGAWEPPIIGWDKYLAAYQAQRARVSGGRMDRTNTFSNVTGNTAWVTYQWTYTAVVDGKPSVSHGHTSLVLNKQADRWVIVLNHTSQVGESTPLAASAPAGPSASTTGDDAGGADGAAAAGAYGNAAQPGRP
jgi:ketosteroid isomerase-like protein